MIVASSVFDTMTFDQLICIIVVVAFAIIAIIGALRGDL